MSGYTWFKLHHDIIQDIKIRRFSAQEKWAWVVLMVLASKNSDRGFISADDEDIADICEFNSVQDWLFFRDKLIQKGLVELSIGGLQILNWENQQSGKPSDRPEATRERKRRQRAKNDKTTDEMSRPCHAMSRDVTPLSRLCHATDKERDQEEEKKRSETRAIAQPDPNPDESNSSHFSFSENLFELSEPANEGDRPTESGNLDLLGQSFEGSETTSIPPRPADPFLARLELPPWRTGRGPNDWNEVVVQGIRSWMQKQFGTEKTRADAISYILRRERPTEADHSVLVARVAEILEQEASRAKKEAIEKEEREASRQSFVSPAPEGWFEQVKKQLAEAQLRGPRLTPRREGE